jgi:prephenate dehydrogenase
MKQVTIIGLGLIGSSLGMALKSLDAPPTVLGNDISWDAANLAGRRKAVDRVEKDVREAVSGAEIVVIATPVGAVPEVLRDIAGSIPPGCLVTDTGSTKRHVVRLAQEILPATAGFVGGHPMTGMATGAVDEPDAGLFRDTVYCLTPTASTPSADVEKLAGMVQGIGASPYFLDPAEHDGLVAGISHLPYLVSASLMKVLAAEGSWRELSELAAGGFELSTRLAGRDPKMYSDILATNADNVVRYLDGLLAELTAARASLASGEPRILGRLEAAHRARTEWEVQRRRAHEAQK